MNRKNDFLEYLALHQQIHASSESNRIQWYLAAGDSTLLLVIKANLVFERLLDRLFEFKFETYTRDIKRLRFSLKLALYEGFGGDKDLTSWLNRFNSVRNAVAHDLDADPRKKLIELCREVLSQIEAEFLTNLDDLDIVLAAVTVQSGALLGDVADLTGQEIVGLEFMLGNGGGFDEL